MANASERAVLIRKMHDSGLTYDEIGHIFGISRQAVHQLANRRINKGDYFNESTTGRIKYDGLRNWMLENRVGLTELTRRCGHTKLYASLIGNSEPSKSAIDAILEVTGLTYEECFKKEY